MTKRDREDERERFDDTAGKRGREGESERGRKESIKVNE